MNDVVQSRLDASVLAGANRGINDIQFIKSRDRLQELRTFLMQEAVYVPEQQAQDVVFGALNLLKWDPKGREPTAPEWTAIETHTQILFGLLSEPLRRRFLMGEIPKIITYLPLGFVAVAIFGLLAAIFLGWVFAKPASIPAVFIGYLCWLISLGGLGSIAFIGMNALSVQSDITFDISNRRLMTLRIILGSLFGLVLALPFGYDDFKTFTGTIGGFVPPVAQGQSPAGELSKQAVMLLLPFVLGFSTTLVIMILNQFVSAIQTFFGRNTSPAASTTSPTRSN